VAIVQCTRCPSEAIIDQPYAASRLCELHFRRSVEDRVRRELHKQLPAFAGGTVAVALSGGKDSSVALWFTHRYFRRRPNVRVVAVSVDEGVAGYRPPTLEAAARLCERLGVEHHIVRASERLGTTTDRAAEAMPDTIPCSFCGVWRRRLLNDGAREVDASVLVLGFNLDDLAQTILMNLARGDIARLARMAPHQSRQPGLVPRIAPLAAIPEREVFLYARLNDLPSDHAECPYAARASRNLYREVVWKLEEEIPGTRHALRRTHEGLRARGLFESEVGAPGRCAECGEPASGPRCRACGYLTELRGAGLVSSEEVP
jgi:uncharacterized protein (TIGR00269 family)